MKLQPTSLIKQHAPLFEGACLADLPAFRCAHAHDAEKGTGCTVVIAPEGATCSVAVRGGGPATRETDLLKPENTIEAVHAVVLAGGSAFGLAASTGVMEELRRHAIGFEIAGTRVPIVTGACLFDLLVGEHAYPDAAIGAHAAQTALSDDSPDLAEGNVGAGCGATVGKMLGPDHAMKTGFGIYGLRKGPLVVVALVAVNAVGTVVDSHGAPLAGHRLPDGTIMDPLAPIGSLTATAAHQPTTNTTIGVVLTNAQLTKAQAEKVSSVTHDAYARAIKPVHTANDGDTVFTFASGEVPAPYDLVAIMATEAMQGAIERAATQATDAYGYPSAQTLRS